MTMAVQQDSFRPGAQRQVEPRREFFEQHARLGDRASLACEFVAQQRRRVFLHRRKQLGSQNRIFSPRSAIGKSASINFAAPALAGPSRPCEISGRPQHPGRTTFDRASAALQHFDCGDADLRIVVIGERVVE